MKSINDYLARITAPHAGKPKFTATVAAVLQPFVDAQEFLIELPQAFDIDTAIGKQLDAVGEWIGQSRDIAIPIPNNFFSFGDQNLSRGWGRGIWKGPYSTANGLVALDDETYRRLLKTIVKANSWDGTVPAAQAILDYFFSEWPNTKVFLQDGGSSGAPSNLFEWGSPLLRHGWGQGVWDEPALHANRRFDPAIIIGVSGTIPSIVLLMILSKQIINIRPAGVRQNVLVTSQDGAPVFGFGVDNDFIGGWGRGAWGISPETLADQGAVQGIPAPPSIPPPPPSSGDPILQLSLDMSQTFPEV